MDDTAGRVDTAGSRVSGPNDETRARTTELAKHAANGDEVDERALEIREEIAVTRDEITETIDAIQEKLKPRNILANATDRVKSATAERVSEMADTAGRTGRQALDYSRQAATSVADSARQNAIPLALIGIGAAWLLNNRSQETSHPYGWRDAWRDEPYAVRDYAEQTTGEPAATPDRWYEQGEDPRRGLMARLRDNPIPTAMAGVGLGWLAFSGGDSGARRQEAWREEPSDYVGPLSSRAKEYASDTADSMRRMARRRSNQIERMVHDNPLLVGAGALLLGAAFGLAVPETETENEWMGEARDTVVERARGAAMDAANEVQEAASTVVDVAKKVTGKADT
jgi:hypothetical protein